MSSFVNIIFGKFVTAIVTGSFVNTTIGRAEFVSLALGLHPCRNRRTAINGAKRKSFMAVVN
jgi:hypothetical protein